MLGLISVSRLETLLFVPTFAVVEDEFSVVLAQVTMGGGSV